MVTSGRAIEIELEWLCTVHSAKIIDDLKIILNTALCACGVDVFSFVFPSSPTETFSPLFPNINLALRGLSKDSNVCHVTVSGDKIKKVELNLTIPDWSRGNELVVHSNPSIAIVLEQIFNAGNLIILALEQIKTIKVPESVEDVHFLQRTLYGKLKEIRKLLNRCVLQLSDVETQSVFPYTVFDSSAFVNAPDDLVLEFFVQNGKLCANVYIISSASHHSTSLGHSRQRSTISQPSATSMMPSNTSTNISSSYYFYNGAPVEIVHHTQLEALLPSTITAMDSIQNSIGILDDFCRKIENIQKLL